MWLNVEVSLKNNYPLASNTNYTVLVERIKKIEAAKNSSYDLVAVTDEKNKFIYANNEFLTTYQYSIAELINITYSYIFIGFTSPRHDLKNDATPNQYLLSRQTLSIKKDNSIVEIYLKVLPIVDEKGEVCGYENVATISTDNKTTEEKFLELLTELERSFKKLPDIFIKIDDQGNINDLKYFDLKNENYTRSIALNGSINLLFQQHIIKKIFKSFKKLQITDEIISFEIPLFIEDSKKIFEATISIITSKLYLITLRDITRIKNTEHAIKKTVSRFYAIWNYSIDGMRLLNKSGIIIAVNPAFCKLVEMQPKDILGKPFYVIYPESIYPKNNEAMEKIRNAFKNRNFKSHFEGELSLKFNKKKYFDIVSTIIESQSRTPLFENDTFLLSIFRDITERKKSEKNISILKQAVESSGEVIFLTDKDGTITYVNPAFSEIYGYKKEEVVGKTTPRILKSGKVSSDHYKEFWENLLSRNSIKSELINQKKDGQEIFIEGTIDPMIDETGEITGFLAVQRDITERKISEGALRNSELLFRSIWEKSYDGMRLSDANGIIISVNNAFCKLVGINKRELIGKPFYIIYQPNSNEELESLINYKKIFSEKKIGSNYWGFSKIHNGKSLFLDVSFSFLEFKDKGSLLFSIFRDDTKYKKIETKLHNSERLAAIGTMSAFLSHEIKNPVSAIKNYVEMLLENKALPDDVRSILKLLYDANSHLSKLLNDVLLFSKNQELIKIKIDLKYLIDKVYELLNKKIAARKIKFENTVSDITILGDYISLISVFANLVENSIEAISENGEIIISAEKNDDYCSIFIKDNGCGIMKKEKIFDPFFTSKSTGTGLGLCIVKKILDYHSSSIKLKSSEPGSTIFEIKFQRKDIDGKDTYY